MAISARGVENTALCDAANSAKNARSLQALDQRISPKAQQFHRRDDEQHLHDAGDEVRCDQAEQHSED